MLTFVFLSAAVWLTGGERFKLYKNSILADAFDLTPGNNDILLFSKTEQTARTANDQRGNSCVLTIKLKVAGIAKPGAVAKVHDFQMAQLRGTAMFHSSKLLSGYKFRCYSICKKCLVLGCPIKFLQKRNWKIPQKRGIFQ